MLKIGFMVIIFCWVSNASYFYEDCERINVALILDSSSGIGADNFNKMLRFSRKLVEKLNIGRNETTVSAMQFSTRPLLMWDFNDSVNKTVLLEKLSKASYKGRKQFLAKALTYVKKTMLRTKRGYRNTLPTVIVIFTDGQADDSAIRRIQHLNRNMNRIVVVPMGVKLRHSQLQRLVSEPWENNTLMSVERVVALIKNDSVGECSIQCPEPFIASECGLFCAPTCDNRLGSVTCNPCIPGCVCPPNTFLHNRQCVTENECPQVNLDIVFLIATPTSVGENNLEIVKDWIKEIVEYLDFSDDRTRVGFQQYSQYHPERPLDDQPYMRSIETPKPFQNLSDIYAAIDKIRLQGTKSFTSRAILSSMYSFANLGRMWGITTKKVLVVIPTVDSEDRHTLISSAETARMLDIYTYAVGIGEVIPSDLQVIATGTESYERVFVVDDYQDLSSITTNVTTSILSTTFSLPKHEKQCPSSLIFHLCATCPTTCASQNQSAQCTEECRMECICAPPKVLYDHQCIDVAECPATPECPDTMVFTGRVDTIRSCDERNQFVLPPANRKPGCTCPLDTFLYNNRCISANECPPHYCSVYRQPVSQVPQRNISLESQTGTPPVCPGNMIFSACAICVPTCDQIGKTISCGGNCRKECTCPPYTYLHGDRCLSAEECSTAGVAPFTQLSEVCPQTMVFSYCAAAVEPCNVALKTQATTCKRECTCPKNTWWDKSKGCVPAAECTPEEEEEEEEVGKTCPGNMVYMKCGPCILTCEERRWNVECATHCNKGCTCPPNTYLLDGICVKRCPEGHIYENYIDLADAVQRIESVCKKITSSISWYNEYSYDQENATAHTMTSIRNGGDGMYDSVGNRVKFYEGENEEKIETLQYNRSNIRLPRFMVSTRAIQPFFLLASINNPGMEDKDYYLKVTGKYGAGNTGQQEQDEGVVRMRNTLVEYKTFQVYNTSKPTICEVFFTIANNDWRSRAEKFDSSLNIGSDGTFNISLYKVSGKTNNLLVGYMLLSRHEGHIIENHEISEVLRIVLEALLDTNTSPTLPEIEKVDLLPTLWPKLNEIENQLDDIFNNTWHNYTYDDTTEPINKIEEGGNGLFKEYGNKVLFGYGQWSEIDDGPVTLNYNQKIFGPVYDIAVQGSSQPFITLVWITNQNSYRRKGFTLKVKSKLGTNDTNGLTEERRSGRLNLWPDESNVLLYRFYQVYGAKEPSVGKLFFSVALKEWNSQGDPEFDLEVSSSLSNFSNVTAKAVIRGQPRNILLGYSLLSKKNGARITVQEIETFLTRLMESWFPKCPPTMVYSECGDCIIPCNERNEEYNCPTRCIKRCTCPPSTFLYDGKCVTEDECQQNE